jgi:hypothetical protein
MRRALGYTLATALFVFYAYAGWEAANLLVAR